MYIRKWNDESAVCDYTRARSESNRERNDTLQTRTIYTQTTVDYECAIAMRVYSYLYCFCERANRQQQRGNGSVCGSGRQCLAAVLRAHLSKNILSVAYAVNFIPVRLLLVYSDCTHKHSKRERARASIYDAKRCIFGARTPPANREMRRQWISDRAQCVFAFASEGESVRELLQWLDENERHLLRKCMRRTRCCLPVATLCVFFCFVLTLLLNCKMFSIHRCGRTVRHIYAMWTHSTVVHMQAATRSRACREGISCAILDGDMPCSANISVDKIEIHIRCGRHRHANACIAIATCWIRCSCRNLDKMNSKHLRMNARSARCGGIAAAIKMPRSHVHDFFSSRRSHRCECLPLMHLLTSAAAVVATVAHTRSCD